MNYLDTTVKSIMVGGGVLLGSSMAYNAIMEENYTSWIERVFCTLWYSTLFIGGGTLGAYYLSQDWGYWLGMAGVTMATVYVSIKIREN